MRKKREGMAMRRSRMRWGLGCGTVLGLVGGLLQAGPALAGDDDRAATADEITRVRTALEGKGYSDVHDVEVDDGRFEVDARNPRGENVDLELDLRSLEILFEDRD
jgi:hypothetical protein